MIGRALSHYEILERIGAGGMGEVYRARDTTLGRDVALKVLPPRFVGDPERVARFRREAAALAALDHPNIVTIFTVEEADECRFLTMQLVPGRPLAALIPPHGMEVSQAARIAIAIAGALAAAHARGVVHRDLKPGNVMVTEDGHVKVLDFGLAKLRQEGGEEPGMSRLSTEQVTVQGVILGTTPYLSPEQAEGRAIDHRSDIFSLGVVLYEMVTGTRPFRGDTPVAVISSILKDAPPKAGDLNSAVPPWLDRVLFRALAKDPSGRYQNALDLKHDLEELLDPSSSVAAPRPASARRRAWRRATALSAAGIGVVAAAWVLLESGLLRSPSGLPQASFAQVTALPGVEQFPSLAPDGEWVVYSGAGPAGDLDVFLQSAGGRTPINLTADSRADDDQPAFSPDGQRIAFRSEREGGGLFVMGRTGEAVRRVTRDGFNPSWSPDGAMLVFAGERVGLMPLNMEGNSELFVVPSDGGPSRPLGSGDGVLPRWSPHGHRIAYQTRLGPNAQMDIMTISPAGGDPTAVLSDPATDWCPTWSPDGRFIYFVSDRGGSMNLWRMAVDEASGRRRGEPEPVTTPASFVAHPTLSADGTRLAFASVIMRQNLQIAAFDPVAMAMAEPAWLTHGSRQWSSPDPSPGGEWVAFYSRDLPEGDIYVVRPDGTGMRQITEGPAVDRMPRWAPDGQRIAYFSTAGGVFEAWTVRVDGSENQRLLGSEPASIVVFSPDGARVAANGIRSAAGLTGAVLIDLARPDERRPLLPPDSALRPLTVNSWSPDGRRLAGMIGYSDDGVVTVDLATDTYERVTTFGQWPVWLPDNRHLLFVSAGSGFHVVDTATRAVREVSSVRRDVLGPPRLTRDGGRVVYSRRTTEADIWLLNFERSRP